jgi:hypothetical protein
LSKLPFQSLSFGLCEKYLANIVKKQTDKDVFLTFVLCKKEKNASNSIEAFYLYGEQNCSADLLYY